MDYECTQAIPLSDEDEETDDGNTNDKRPVAQLLVHCQKGFPETVFPLYEGDNVVGRQQDKVNIYVPLKAISKQHACIEIRDKEVHFIYDMESRNKTRRGKMFLTPKARYELKDGDKILFGDVTCVYKKIIQLEPEDGSETGSETGSESMLINVSAVNSQNDSDGPGEEGNVSRVEESILEDDAASDVSIDLLAATQAYGADGNPLVVEETPMPVRTKAISRVDDSDIVVPESPLDDNDSDKNVSIFDAPTQAFKAEEEATTLSDVFVCPTQAYGNPADDDDDATDDEAGIFNAPTQAYPAFDGESPVFDGPTQAYGNQEDTDATQAYELAKETIDATVAYSMDGCKPSTVKTKPVNIPKQESIGFAPKGKTGDSESDPSFLSEPTQAYPDPDAAYGHNAATQPYGDATLHVPLFGATLASPKAGYSGATISSSADTMSPGSLSSQLKKDNSGASDIGETLILSSPKDIAPVTEVTDTLVLSPGAEPSVSSKPAKVVKKMVEGDATLMLGETVDARDLATLPTEDVRGVPGKRTKRDLEDVSSSEEASEKLRELDTQILSSSPSPPKKVKKVSIFSDQPTQIFGADLEEDGSAGFDKQEEDVEATQAYGDDGDTPTMEEAPTQAYGDDEISSKRIEDMETLAYEDEMETQAYGENMETQAYGDQGETQAYGENLETQAYGGDEVSSSKVEDLETQAYGDQGEAQAYGENLETQAYGDDEVKSSKVEDLETQAYGDQGEAQAYGENLETQAYGDDEVKSSKVEDLVTQAYGDQGETQAYGENVETQAYGDDEVRTRDMDDMETQAFGEVDGSPMPDDDDKETHNYDDFPESMPDIFDDDFTRKSHVFRKPVIEDDDDDETPPMTEELDELPDLADVTPAAEPNLDVPADVFGEAEEESEEDAKFENSPSKLKTKGGNRRGKQKDFKEAGRSKVAEVVKKSVGVGRRQGQHKRIESEDGVVFLSEVGDVTAVDGGNGEPDGFAGMKDSVKSRNEGVESENTAELPSKSKRGKKVQGGVSSQSRRRGVIVSDDEESIQTDCSYEVHVDDAETDKSEVSKSRSRRQRNLKGADVPATSVDTDAVKDTEEKKGRGKVKRGAEKTSDENDKSDDILPVSKTSRSRRQKPGKDGGDDLAPAEVEGHSPEVPSRRGGRNAGKKSDEGTESGVGKDKDVVKSSQKKAVKETVELSEPTDTVSVGRSARGRRRTGKKKDNDEISVTSEIPDEDVAPIETGSKPAVEGNVPTVRSSRGRRGTGSKNNDDEVSVVPEITVADMTPSAVVDDNVPADKCSRGRRRTGKKKDDELSVASEISGEVVTQSAMSSKPVATEDNIPLGKGSRGRRITGKKKDDDEESGTSEIPDENVTPPETSSKPVVEDNVAVVKSSRGRRRTGRKTNDDEVSIASEIPDEDVTQPTTSSKTVVPGDNVVTDKSSRSRRRTGKKNNDEVTVTSEIPDGGRKPVLEDNVPAVKSLQGRRGTGKKKDDDSQKEEGSEKDVKLTRGAMVKKTSPAKTSAATPKRSRRSVGFSGLEDDQESVQSEASVESGRGAKGRGRRGKSGDVGEGPSKVEEDMDEKSTESRSARKGGKNNGVEEEIETVTLKGRGRGSKNVTEVITEDSKLKVEASTPKSRGARTKDGQVEIDTEPAKPRGRQARKGNDMANSEVSTKGRRGNSKSDESESRSRSGSRRQQPVKEDAPSAPRGRGGRSGQAAANDDDTDSLSTISENPSEISTASSAARGTALSTKGRKGRTKTTEVSASPKQPATTPKQTPKQSARGKRAADGISKEAASTPSSGKKAKLKPEVFSSPRLQHKADELRPKILFTGVIDEKAQKVVKDLGGELVTGTEDCTHLVTDRVRRTVKFLCCLNQGVPIVLTDWLDRCADAKTFVDHAPYIVKDTENEKKFGFKLLTSLQKANEEKLFTGYKIHVTKKVKPDPANMKEIISSGEGTFLATMPKKGDDKTVIVSCDDDKKACQTAITGGIPVVSNEFILTGVLQQTLDIEKFLLFSENKAGEAKKRQAETSSGVAKKRRR